MMEDLVTKAMSEMAAEKISSAEADLRATGLVKIYGDRTVVNGMNVRCSCGEIVGLLGPNGAGKTTTFYMIVGLVKPDGGSVVFRGEDITRLPVFMRARKGLGYLAQEASIFRKLSVWDNVMAILETLPMSRKERRARAEELLAPFDLMKVAKQPAYTLSGGERRKLEIAPREGEGAGHNHNGPQRARDALGRRPRVHGVRRKAPQGGAHVRARG